MIEHIEGRLVEKTPTYAVIDCGGVGYRIHISLNTFSRIGDSEKCKLYTHLAIREDAHVLFGFFEKSERELFLQLISVSGVGPATARMLLSSSSPAELQDAIITQNVSLLKNIKGIGAKTAERIIVDLRGKLQKDTVSASVLFASRLPIVDEALSALMALGFVKAQAEKALDKIAKDELQKSNVEQLIKLALKNL
jgi:Holliday junction DNA helicase RuvA